MSIESARPSNHPIFCRPLLLPSIFPSIRVFSNESALRIRWPKYWRFSFNISLSNEYSGLISFRMDWLDLLAVQGTLKSLLQYHSSKASIFLCSAFFIVQLSHPYMTTGKTIALTRWTFVGKVMSLLFKWKNKKQVLQLHFFHIELSDSEVKVLLSRVRLVATQWTVAHQAPLSIGFPRQEHWRRLPFLSPRDLPTPRTESRSSTLQAGSLPSEPHREEFSSFPLLEKWNSSPNDFLLFVSELGASGKYI